jgi:hypothetical protein
MYQKAIKQDEVDAVAACSTFPLAKERDSKVRRSAFQTSPLLEQ